jgi:SAM-dependent methyltransferase
MAVDPEEFLSRQRAVWAAGDYADLARTIEGVSGEVVEAAGVQDGDAVLDVATGSGNAALRAAARGARVTGLDLTPELLAVAGRRADEAGFDIAFTEGTANDLPYPDASFDRVVSVFGAIFAPDHERTASELLRVTRPGGTVAVTAWTPDGLNGKMFNALARHLPPPPEDFEPPVLWGSEDYVRQLFGGAAEIRTERRRAMDSVAGESADAWVTYLERVLGPTAQAKRALESEGRWEAARADLVALYEAENEVSDGTLRAHPEYLLTVARRAG